MKTLSSVYGPLVKGMHPWTRLEDGGFETLPLVMIRNRTQKALEAYDKNHDMPLVYKALNAIQATSYTINKRVYEVAIALRERKLAIAGLPEPYDKRTHEHPSRQDPTGTFKRRYSVEILGKNIACELTLKVASTYLDEDSFTFVHTLDFRGRVYPVTSHLSPQGNDLNKGLLTFAASQGRPLGKDGVKWLAIHGANCYGVDKVSFDERVAWTTEHQERI